MGTTRRWRSLRSGPPATATSSPGTTRTSGMQRSGLSPSRLRQTSWGRATAAWSQWTPPLRGVPLQAGGTSDSGASLPLPPDSDWRVPPRWFRCALRLAGAAQVGVTAGAGAGSQSCRGAVGTRARRAQAGRGGPARGNTTRASPAFLDNCLAEHCESA
jgi:hypothetical protein